MTNSLFTSLALSGLLAAAVASAGDQLDPVDAVNHIGEEATVCGAVTGTKFSDHRKRKPTFIDFGPAHPNQVFTALIWGEYRARFDYAPESLLGKTICVSGTISEHKGKPEIKVSDPSQIQVTGDSAARDSAPSSGQRVVLITGSTGGLGRETARALARQGDHVIIHGRNEERGKGLVSEIEAEVRGSARFYRADFGSLREVRNLANAIIEDYERLDVLVNNAGIFSPDQQERRVSEDGYELHFQVNYLAGYVLTGMLTPLLESSAPSRIINVASGQRPIDFDNLMLEVDYDGMQAYFQSKNAQIMMTFHLADELAGRGITINAMHPSNLMNTDMVIEAGFEPQTPVETGRDALVRLINEDVGTGKFFNVFEEADAIPQAYDAEAVARLMKVSEELVSASAAGSD
jgi:NAD(P)-dependent dehydrogenase (short-subunit alcohol dehydrogenase family)